MSSADSGEMSRWDSMDGGRLGADILAVGASASGSQQNLRAISSTPSGGGGSTAGADTASNDGGNGVIVRSSSLSDILPRQDGSTSGSKLARNTSATGSDVRSIGSPMPSHFASSGSHYSHCSEGDFQFRGSGSHRRSPSNVSNRSSSISGEFDIADLNDARSFTSSLSHATAHSNTSSLPARDFRKDELSTSVMSYPYQLLTYRGAETGSNAASCGSPRVTTESWYLTCVVFCAVPNRRLFCTLCNKVYKDPVITTCGHTFCRRCCTSRANEKCPTDNCQISVVVANLAVSDQVGELQLHCRYGCRLIEGKTEEWEVDPNGCPATMKLSHRKVHEQNCVYALVRCPNSEMCQSVMRKHLDEHLRTCDHYACPHKRYNCPFRGAKAAVEEHVKTCRFELIKDILSEFDEKISNLQRDVKRKDDEVTFLRTMLANVSDRLNLLEKNYEFRMERLDDSTGKLNREVTEYRNQVNYLIETARSGVAHDVHNFKCVGTFVGHDGPVWSLCTNGDLVYSGSSDNTIKVWGPVPTTWDPNVTYRCQRTLPGHTGIVLALATWKDFLYSGGADNTIRIWHLESFTLEGTLHAHENPVCTLAAARGLLFSGSLKTIKVWDTSQRTVVKELTGQNHWVRTLVATDRYLYAGSYQSINVWDLDNFETVHVVNVSGGSVYSLLITNDLLICGTYENSIHVWSLNSFEQTNTLTGHVGTVYSLIVINTQGQNRLFSASYDRTIRVWNLESMACIQTLIRHQGSVSCLATMHGRLYSGAVDHCVKVWQ